jgi:hypothetical protein
LLRFHLKRESCRTTRLCEEKKKEFNMQNNLPIYRKTTALMLLVLLFCYIFFYSDAEQKKA